MKHRNLFLFGVLFLLASCISDIEMEAGRKVAILMGAEDFAVGVETTTRDKKISTLRIKNFNDSGKGLSIDQISSFAAINFIDNLPKSRLKNNQYLKIIIDNDTGKQESIYLVNDVQRAKDCYVLLQTFLKNYAKTEHPFSQMDTAYIPATDVMHFYGMEREYVNQANQQFQFVGFKFGKLEIDQSPTVVIWINRINGEEMSRYTFYLLLKTKKIIHIGIETIKNGTVKKKI